MGKIIAEPMSPFAFDGISDFRALSAETNEIEIFENEGVAIAEDKPHVRKVDDKIHRLERPLYVDKLSKRKASQFFIDQELSAKDYVPVDEYAIELGGRLDEWDNKLQFELEELSDAGVPVRTPEIEIGNIPEYDKKGKVIGSILGLRIISDFVEGPTLLDFEPTTEEEANDFILHTEMLYDDYIVNYLEKKQAMREIFLGAVISPRSFRFGTIKDIGVPDTWLIKESPIFMTPTDKHFDFAFKAVEKAKSIINKIIEESCVECED